MLRQHRTVCNSLCNPVWGQCCLLLKKELFKVPSVWPGLKRHLLFSSDRQSRHIWSRKRRRNAARPKGSGVLSRWPCSGFAFLVPFPQPRPLVLQVRLGWLGHQRAAGFGTRGQAPAPSLSIFYPHVIASNIPSNTIPQETKGPIQRLHAPHGRVLFIYWKPDLKPSPTWLFPVL